MPAEENYKVNGTIYDEHNSPLNNVKVKLFEVNLRSEKLLGSKFTDQKGVYALSFKGMSAMNAGDKSPDIVVKVFGADKKLLGQSPIYFNVQLQSVIDYKLGGTEYTGLNEFDALLQLIEPVIKPSGIKLGELQENDQFKDMSFIAGETQTNASHINYMNTAYAFSKKTNIAPEIFYALFRMGFPTDLDEILMNKPKHVIKVLSKAVEENIISGKWLKVNDEIVIQFNRLLALLILNGGDANDAPALTTKLIALKRLLNTALGSPAAQKEFIEAWLENEEIPEIFWNSLDPNKPHARIVMQQRSEHVVPLLFALLSFR